MRSMPLSSDISTRLTRGTGASTRPAGCQMNASAVSNPGCRGGGRGEPFQGGGDAFEEVDRDRGNRGLRQGH